MASVYDFSAQGLDGSDVPLKRFEGKVLLIVNVASKCGFTPQYAGLESLYRRLAPEGLAVLGFPCDQFGHQEPGDPAAIRDFCTLNYGVSFPLFAKIEVNGDGAHPLYRYLKHRAKGILGTERIKWNFTKFLVDRGGQVVSRFSPADTPASIENDVAALL